MRLIHSESVHGSLVDNETRCSHYQSETDIIAIKFKCCGKWFPCRQCHDSAESHAAEVWPIDRRDEKAILCGKCGRQLAVNEYLECGNVCPSCEHAFNPKCATHYGLYFDMNDR